MAVNSEDGHTFMCSRIFVQEHWWIMKWLGSLRACVFCYFTFSFFLFHIWQWQCCFSVHFPHGKAHKSDWIHVSVDLWYICLVPTARGRESEGRKRPVSASNNANAQCGLFLEQDSHREWHYTTRILVAIVKRQIHELQSTGDSADAKVSHIK